MPDKIKIEDGYYKDIEFEAFVGFNSREGKPFLYLFKTGDKNGYTFYRDTLKKMLARIDNVYPKKRKGKTAYGADCCGGGCPCK
jgi:hypothetical protein